MARISIKIGREGTDGKCPLLIMVSQKGKTAYVTLDERAEAKDWTGEVGRWVKGKRALNDQLSLYLLEGNQRLDDIPRIQRDRMTAGEIRDRIDPTGRRRAGLMGRDDDFLARWDDFVARKDNAGTRQIYERTRQAILSFDEGVEGKGFDWIDRRWLERFEQHYRGKGLTDNTIAMYERNIKAVFNDALKDELTIPYPFKAHRIPRGKMSEQAPYSLDELRQLFTTPCLEGQEEWLDLAKVIFLLCGINMVDLAKLTKIDHDGYIRYTRTKTGVQVAIYAEPELRDIVEKWKGERHLLRVFDRYADYKTVDYRMKYNVRRLGMERDKGGQLPGKQRRETLSRRSKRVEGSLYPDFNLYKLRYTWATIAANDCDLYVDDIDYGLQHATKTAVVYRYIKTDKDKRASRANRIVIDKVRETEGETGRKVF